MLRKDLVLLIFNLDLLYFVLCNGVEPCSRTVDAKLVTFNWFLNLFFSHFHVPWNAFVLIKYVHITNCALPDVALEPHFSGRDRCWDEGFPPIFRLLITALWLVRFNFSGISFGDRVL